MTRQRLGQHKRHIEASRRHTGAFALDRHHMPEPPCASWSSRLVQTAPWIGIEGREVRLWWSGRAGAAQ